MELATRAQNSLGVDMDIFQELQAAKVLLAIELISSRLQAWVEQEDYHLVFWTLGSIVEMEENRSRRDPKWPTS